MTLPETISADYTLRPSELAEVLALLVEARQPTMVWGPPGAAKSMIARQVADTGNRQYVDVRALLLDPVDLRGIPWRDSADRTRWAPPVFLPPSDDPGLWLINLEELPSAVPMVQAALYQLFLERKCGEYELPEGASLIACGNRDADRAVVHRMPTPLSNRLVHLEIRVDARDWCNWGAANGIAPEVLFFIELEPELLHAFEPQSKEHAFPSPRSWEFASNIVKHRNGLDPEVERALFRGTVGEAAAVQFTAFLKVWRELPHPRAVINDPVNADIPQNASTLMALCGSLYRITPVPDADHFIAQLASDDTERVKRDIERHVEEQLHGAVGDLYRRMAEAVERVSERLQEDDDGKPLVFRDTMISNIRDLVDVVPRLNIFGDETLAQLCEQVKEKIASVEPDALRPSRTFDPAARAQVKRDADALVEKFAGYFGSRAEEPAAEPVREAA